jgi:hypothetical protein
MKRIYLFLLGVLFVMVGCERPAQEDVWVELQGRQWEFVQVEQSAMKFNASAAEQDVEVDAKQGFTVFALDKNVKDHEPMSALDGGEDGLDYYRIIAKDAKEHLKEGGDLLVEIGYDQGEEVSALFAENGYADIEIIKDLSGLDRVVACRTAQE